MNIFCSAGSDLFIMNYGKPDGLIFSYDLYHEFFRRYLSTGFMHIDRSDELVQQLEHQTEIADQMFFAGDLIKLQILFASNRSRSMLGVDPDQLHPGIFFISTHPEDIARHNVARTKLFNVGQQLYIDQSCSALLSTNFRFKGPDGNFRNTLVQCYLFYCRNPFNTVFLLQVNTNISWFRKIKHGFHYYLGDDLSYFRYPDKTLLETGNTFSYREFDIIRLLSEGLSSEQIATRLFLSPHTINTHRRNILRKVRMQSTNELILELKERGLI